MSQRALPTGYCWCGCGQETGSRAFFVSGHDRIAEANVVFMAYGGVPELLLAHGYGPGEKNLNDLRLTQQQFMRELVRKYGNKEELVTSEYAAAESRGEVKRLSNTHGWTALQ